MFMVVSLSLSLSRERKMKKNKNVSFKKFWTFNCIKLPVGSFIIIKQNNNRRYDVGSLWKLSFTPQSTSSFKWVSIKIHKKVFIQKKRMANESFQKQQQQQQWIQQSSINCDCSLNLIPLRSLHYLKRHEAKRSSWHILPRRWKTSISHITHSFRWFIRLRLKEIK